ncbi:protein transport protein Sec24A-like isoform X1 [Homalodisca vitripennis]|uniref:protein transport protein Sec24A-like isoform X1 n=1 Tax=Homalodisca vitripennis TaxID=197043 RepID=UPI001EEAB56D|nr:protein transport protein Sec24A-like isoform X1 [Homalodisca vitripennis]
MNGQQLTNSSNSANGTPSSSYPASLSSQSSRDPSPATRPLKPPSEQYNHVISAQANHWPKDKPNALLSSMPDPAISRPGPQLHRSTPLSSPIPTPQPPSTLHQSQPNLQSFQTTTTQPVGGPPAHPRPLLLNHQAKPPNPSSQSLYRQPPPTSLSQSLPPTSTTQTIPSVPLANHLPQPNSIPNQFPTPARPPNYSSTQTNQPLEPPRSTQSPLQQSLSQFQTQSPVPSSNNQFTQHANQFKPPTPLQHVSSQGPRLPIQTSRPPYQFPQLPNQISQSSEQIPPSSNKLPPAPEQTLPNHTMPQPQHQFTQSSYQYTPPQNQFSQPQNQINQPPSQFFKPPNQMPQSQNQFAQPPGQYPHQMSPGQPPHLQTQYPNSTSTPTPGYQQPPMQQIPNQFNKRYPQMPQNPGYQQQPGSIDGLTPQLAGMTVVQQGFNKLWGMDTVDLLKSRDVLPKEKVEPPAVRLQHELYEAANCSPEIFRCTLTKIPETKSLLDKSRLPLGVLIHPFKDLNGDSQIIEEGATDGLWEQQTNPKQLSVIQCTVIVRCRMCRTYINPFVYFVDNKRWKCNLCFRVNELPDEFQFDPMTKTYGDPSRRPEIKSATIEFIAPSEYMVRPPQPAIYVFVLDVSRLACESGYLDVVCRTLLAELDNVPGDARTSVAFITFDSAVHFYSLTEGQGQPHQLIVVDIDDMFLPTPDNLLVSLNECRDLIRDLLTQLPNKYRESYDTHSALGAALQAAYKLLVCTQPS